MIHNTHWVPSSRRASEKHRKGLSCRSTHFGSPFFRDIEKTISFEDNLEEEQSMHFKDIVGANVPPTCGSHQPWNHVPYRVKHSLENTGWSWIKMIRLPVGKQPNEWKTPRPRMSHTRTPKRGVCSQSTGREVRDVPMVWKTDKNTSEKVQSAGKKMWRPKKETK